MHFTNEGPARWKATWPALSCLSFIWEHQPQYKTGCWLLLLLLQNSSHPWSLRILSFSLGEKKKDLIVPTEILKPAAIHQFSQSLPCWDIDLLLWQLILVSPLWTEQWWPAFPGPRAASCSAPLGPHFDVLMSCNQRQCRTVSWGEHLIWAIA